MAERSAARQQANEARQRQQLAHEAKVKEAASLTMAIEVHVAAIRNLLRDGLSSRPDIPFSVLKRRSPRPRFDPGELATEGVPPQWEEFTPTPPSSFRMMFGQPAWYIDALNEAKVAFSEAEKQYERDESARIALLAQARERHLRQIAELETSDQLHNAWVDSMERDFRAGGHDAVVEYIGRVLSRSALPQGFPSQFRIEYRPELRELVVERCLPGADVIPSARSYRYIKNRKEVAPVARSERERRDLYRTMVCQFALRTLFECFTASPADVVDSVVFNGVVNSFDPATGQPARPHLVSVSVARASYNELVLDRVDPESCLSRLQVVLSPHPYDLEPVKPVLDFDKAKYRFTDPVDVLAGLDSLPNLLEMDWQEFEHLVRQLLATMFTEVEITQSSKDQGLDAVAYIKGDGIQRAEFVVQAKRYKDVVPAETVRALSGTMEEHRAHGAICVATSWYGDASRKFASKNNRIQLIEGPELKQMLKEKLGLDVRIPLDKAPRRLRELAVDS
ncbi:restriction endonuclease [Actinopolymorpha sp. NPDC004070]|uniref:restriction endonuclease n=1 Tax=Actinopolymorpha sp. NPDC004070 TaxID=3154548 RepID=UPI0033AFCA7D